MHVNKLNLLQNVSFFFLCSYLLPERSKSSRQKTSVCRRTLNPKWEHTATWEAVSLHELAADRSLEITVWDHDRLGLHSELLGGIRFNLGNGESSGNPLLAFRARSTECPRNGL